MNEQRKLRPEPVDEPVSLNDLSPDELREVEEAEADFAAGRTFSHEEMTRWMRAQAKKISGATQRK